MKLIALMVDSSKVNSSANQADWEKVKNQLGWLKLDKDPVAWQQEIRSQWDCRK